MNHCHTYQPGDRFEDEHGEPQVVEGVIAHILYYKTGTGRHSIKMSDAIWIPTVEDQEQLEKFFLDRVRHQLPLQPDRHFDEIDIALTFRPSSEQLEATPERQSGRS